jgi:hypothetical protein
MRRGLSWVVLILGGLVFAALPASASITTYTDSTSFQTAITGFSSSTVNFDALSVGPISEGTTLGGITFTSSLGGGDGLAIQSLFDTTSPSNYLGSTDLSGAFFPGDSITMTFNPVNALGMFIITDAAPNANDFSLSTSSGIAQNSATVLQVLPDFGQVIFLGLTSTSNFSSATLTLDSGAGELWNVDDITTAAPLPPTPEPGTFVLMGSGFLLLFRRLRKAV